MKEKKHVKMKEEEEAAWKLISKLSGALWCEKCEENGSREHHFNPHDKEPWCTFGCVSWLWWASMHPLVQLDSNRRVRKYPAVLGNIAWERVTSLKLSSCWNSPVPP